MGLMITDTPTIEPADVREGDIVRFRPLGYRNRVTVRATGVRTMDGWEGYILDGLRARVERDGDYLVVITRGEKTGWSIRGAVELIRRLDEVLAETGRA